MPTYFIYTTHTIPTLALYRYLNVFYKHCSSNPNPTKLKGQLPELELFVISRFSAYLYRAVRYIDGNRLYNANYLIHLHSQSLQTTNHVQYSMCITHTVYIVCYKCNASMTCTWSSQYILYWYLDLLHKNIHK